MCVSFPAQRLQAEIAHRGFYSFKVNAADFLDPYDPEVRSKPELYEVAMNSQLSSQLSDTTVVTIGGMHLSESREHCALSMCSHPDKTSIYDCMHGLQWSPQMSTQLMHVIAGQMAVQGNVGGGSFVCGLRRVLGEYHNLEFQGALGELYIACYQVP